MASLQAVAPIPATPPRYGLLAAADVVESATVRGQGIEQPADERWTQGITWAPELLAGAGAIALECEGDTAAVTALDQEPAGEATPFVVYSVDKCSTFGFAARDYTARALRALRASQSYSVAREFQLGAIAGADNANLIDAALVDPSPASVSNAFGELEGAIGERLQGSQAMIHVTPQVFTIAMRDHLIYLAGQKWLTAQGTVVVSDAGFTDESGTVYAYATPLVKVYLSPVDIIPGSFEDAQRAAAVDRSINDVMIVAERLALVQVDSGADVDAFFKVEINIEPWVLD